MKEILKKLITEESPVLNACRKSLEKKEELFVTYFNQHCFNVCVEDGRYRNVLSGKTLVYLDGMGIYGAMKFFGKRDVEKFNASDLNEKIFKYFIEKQNKVFIIGGNFEKSFIEEKSYAAGINLSGYSNGFFPPEEWEAVAGRILESEPEIVVIGMGVPLQEKFAAFLSEKSKVDLILCVGNFLEFYFGTVKRAPEIFRNIGLEWLHRLFSEPKRLAGRYLIGGPVFLLRILSLRIKYGKMFYDEK